MQTIKYLILVFTLYLVGCSNMQKHHVYNPKFPLPGTKTSVVRIGIDSDGTPSVIPEEIIIKKGQRVVLVGPSAFEIYFPKGSPFKESKFSTTNSVISLIVPRKKKQKSNSQSKQIRFKYDITVKGKRLDPYMVMPPE